MAVFLIPISLFFLFGSPVHNFAKDDCWKLARLQYGGGGDWYANPTALPNMMARARRDLGVNFCREEENLRLFDERLYDFPFLFATGHGNISFSPEERRVLREYLYRGGFFLVDDTYGLDTSFRKEMKALFSESPLTELKSDHSIFKSRYTVRKLPKVHEHDGKRPQLFGIEINEKIAVLYTYESDLSDGWEDADVHKDPPEIREEALRMGVNIVAWYLQGQSLK